MPDEQDKALDRLRATAQQLSTTINRHAFVRVAAMAIFVFAFADATGGPRTAEIESDRKDIFTLGVVANRTDGVEAPGPFDGFLIFKAIFGPREGHSYGLPFVGFSSSSGNTDDGTGKLAAYGVLVRHKKWTNVTDAERLGESRAREDAEAVQDLLIEKIRETYRSIFQIEFSVIGAKLRIDLRTWFILFPIVLLFSQVYLSLERHKLALVRRVIDQWTNPDPSTPTTGSVDHLLVSTEAANKGFGRYPAVLLERAYAVSQVGLLLYLALALKLLAGRWDNFFLFMAAVTCVASPILWISSRYVRAAKQTLDASVKKATGVQVPVETTRLRSLFAGLSRQPKRLMQVGAALVLLSILMPIGGCSGHIKGYQMLLRQSAVVSTPSGSEQDEFLWYTLFFSDYEAPMGEVLAVIQQEGGYAIYVLSVVLSVFTLGLMMRGQVWKRPWFWQTGRIVSSLCFCFVVSDLFAATLPVVVKVVFLPIAWVVPFILHIRCRRHTDPPPTIPLPWQLPLVAGAYIVLACIYFAYQTADKPDPYRAELGMFTLLTGIVCLTAGYWRLTSLEVEPSRRTVSPAP